MSTRSGGNGPPFLALVLFFAACAAPEQVDFDRWFAHIAPREADRWYGRHDWLPDAGAGFYAAAASDRPLLLWILSGDPLSCDCAHELEGPRSVWSDPTVERFVAESVPAADAIWELLTRDDAASRWLSEQLGGSPRSGVYLLAASGELLADCHSLVRDVLLDALGRGLERFEELGPSRSTPARAPQGLLEHRFERYRPEHGLVLTCFTRELPGELDPAGARSQVVRTDQVWFSAEERRGLVPDGLVPGERFEVPRPLALRLARLHFLDDLRGPVRPFSAAEVERADWSGWLVSKDSGRLELEYAGRTRAVGRDEETGEFGVETSFSGRAEFDRRTARFSSFRLVARGVRFGRALTNARVGQEAPSPIGFALEPTGASLLRFAPPRHADFYRATGFSPVKANAGTGR